MRAAEVCDPSLNSTTLAHLAPEARERLADLLDRYLRSLESGVPLDPEALAGECPELAEPLLGYVRSLSALHGMAAGFAGNVVSAEDVAAEEDAGRENTFHGEQRLGDFVLKREIGRGGMGVVYEAWQISLGRMVALKILPFAAVLDAKQIARFKNEAQAAAQLHHPNIVPVFAIGVERGVHYYAMPYIDGQPLDRAIAQLRQERASGRAGRGSEAASAFSSGSLGTRTSRRAENGEANDACPSTVPISLLTERSPNAGHYFRTVARLGIQAAEAIHAAHEYGVVHRDIKPSNLLLDLQGKLWITDFGLARCQSETSLTKTGDVLGTLRYMSPEQALGRSALVDQRTDIYSLAVTLYELLTLRAAYAGDNGPEMLRQIESQEPLRPRQIDGRIPADLETVVLKAMSKIREDRYTTAQEFAEDLGRFLEGKPTVARPATVVDRLAKWARRHRKFVVGSAAACLVLITGLAISTMLIAQAKVEADKNYAQAQYNFRQARQVVDRLGARLAHRLAGIAGAEHVRRDLLEDTLGYYRDFIAQVGDEPSLTADLALTHSKIAAIQEQIESKEQAIVEYERAIALFEQLQLQEPDVAEHRRDLARCQNNLALLLAEGGKTELADAAYRSAIRVQEQLVGDHPGEPEYITDLGLSHSNRGLLYSQLGRPDEAEASYREAIGAQRGLVAGSAPAADALRNLAASHNNLAALFAESQPERAIESYGEALGLLTRLAQIKPEVLEHQSAVAMAHNNLGAVQSRAGKGTEAEASYQRAIAAQLELVSRAEAQKAYRRDLAYSYNNLGQLQVKLHRAKDAEQSFREAVGLLETLTRQHPRDIGFQGSLGGVHNNLGIVLEELGRTGEAAEAYERAAKCTQAALEGAPKMGQFRSFLSKIHYNQGRVLRVLGRPREAAEIALRRRALLTDQPQRLVSVAEELALAAAMLRQDATTRGSARSYGDAAVAVLREVREAGHAPQNLREHEVFKSLKDYEGFAELVH
jgi:serine/threonine protein kinase/tetratricopeptide (TPR) repeat protein